MSDEKRGLVGLVKDYLATSKSKLSLSDAVEIAELTVASTEQKFLDVEYDGKVLRVEGESLEVGAVVSTVDENGVQLPVEDGEYVLPEYGTIVVAESKIVEIKPTEEQEEEVEKSEEDAEEAFDAEVSYNELASKIDALTEMMGKFSEKEDTDFDAKFAELKSEFEAQIKNEMKNIPAIGAENTKHNFGATQKSNGLNGFADKWKAARK